MWTLNNKDVRNKFTKISTIENSKSYNTIDDYNYIINTC